MSPLVSVIVPVRNSQQHIKGLLRSLFDQDYPNIQIVLVGNVNDQTWQPIRKWIQEGRVTTIEVQLPEGWTGRDSNLKRNTGALHAFGGILVFTDQKIRHPRNWISRGVAMMQQQQVPALAGTMLSTRSDGDSFWARFTDGALVKRNPEFRQGRILNARNFGATESLPITANWFMTYEAYLKMGGFPEDFRDSYEDYAGAWKAVSNGVSFYCTDDLPVYHKHRLDPRQIQREYIRSARGAAQLFMTFGDCPFGRRRALQVIGVMLMGTGVILTSAILVLLTEWLLLLTLTQIVVLLLVVASLLNFMKVRHWHGLFFPPITFYFIFIFSWHFMQKCLEGGGITSSDRYLQT
ncbi:MAG: glycosyltransferase [Anaerolineae bacterium]|nr:glycosyltransferase [Anaerolineae bacterium]